MIETKIVKPVEYWYIAGPMRHRRHFNFPAFIEAEEVLREHLVVGLAVDGFIFNPAGQDINTGFDPIALDLTGNEDLTEYGFNLREAMADDLRYVAGEATDILLLPEWELSTGACIEHDLAKTLGLRIWELVDGRVRRTGTFLRLFPQTPSTDNTGPVRQDTEQRVTSETGGQKGRKPAELAFVDPIALLKLAEVAGYGAQKYDKFNYLRGFDWTLAMNALYRHFLAFQSGENDDTESGLPHMAHAAWHALSLVSFLERGIGNDDRIQPLPGLDWDSLGLLLDVEKA